MIKTYDDGSSVIDWRPVQDVPRPSAGYISCWECQLLRIDGKWTDGNDYYDSLYECVSASSSVLIVPMDQGCAAQKLEKMKTGKTIQILNKKKSQYTRCTSDESCESYEPLCMFVRFVLAEALLTVGPWERQQGACICVIFHLCKKEATIFVLL